MESFKSWITLVVVIAVCVFGVVTISKYIDNKVIKLTQTLQENNEKEKAEIETKLEHEKNELEKKLKLQIIDIEAQLNMCKNELQEKQKKQEFKEMSKKNPKQFRKQVETILGVKGKK